MLVRRSAVILGLTAFLALPLWCGADARAQGPQAMPYASEPALSPDGKTVAFVSGGDIWTVTAGNPEARLLVSHPATEGRPLFSPDGKELAFTSTRTGNGDLYVLTLATGELRRITFDDASEQLNGWSRDGKWLYFSSGAGDIDGLHDVYRVPASGGTPMPVAADRFTNEYQAAPAPDGQSLALCVRGTGTTQWWRHGHSHLDQSEICRVRLGAAPQYERLAGGEGKDGAKYLWPMWSPDGQTLYFVSDRGGPENIWRRGADGKLTQVTRFTDGRVLWPSISYDGQTILFEREFGIWWLDTATGQARPVPIQRVGVSGGASVDHLTLTSGWGELALSPDGKKLAFTARGQVFAAAAGGGDAVRLTLSNGIHQQLQWAPDSRRLVYVSNRDGNQHLFQYDFTTRAETRLTDGPHDDYAPRFSPDGKRLAFQRDARELHYLQLEPREEHLLASGYFSRPPFIADRPYVWSADGKWIAYLSSGSRGFENISVVPLDGSAEPRAVSFLPNTNSGSLSWTPDARTLFFTTGQRTEQDRLARVDLVPRAQPRFREDTFRDLFKDPVKPQPAPPVNPAAMPPAAPAPMPPAATAPPAESKPAPPASAPAKPLVEINWAGLRERQTFVPAGMEVEDHAVSPDGKTLVFVGNLAGRRDLYTLALSNDAPAVPRQITSTGRAKSDLNFSPDGRELFYLEAGQIQALPLDTRVARDIAVTAELDVDFNAEKAEVFDQAWGYLRDFFFDEKFNGVDWPATRARFAPYVAGARTGDELRRILSLMLGELNASHMGISRRIASADAAGKLGLRWDRDVYEREGRLRVTEVIPNGPAALADGVKVGEYVLEVDGQPVTRAANLDELLQHRIARRVELTVAASPSGEGKRTVAVRPISGNAERDLLYKSWVQSRRAYVEKLSGGRLGYVHIPDMSSQSLEQLYTDLDAENQARDGVVIDIRHNNGGFVNAYALDVLARRSYLMMVPRGQPGAPARAILGQRALESPTVLVTDQNSLSDAEDFTEGYRALKLGKVVGEPTAGWIIFTSNVPLVDGSSVRLPFTRILDHEGKAMEMHPRPVDVTVVRPAGESYTERDSQLDAAVKELLGQVGREKRR